MTAPKEQHSPQLQTEYQRAQQIINESIATMDGKAHIEYHSTIERDRPPSLLKQWRQRLQRLFS